jgi:hypothetical protein
MSPKSYGNSREYLLARLERDAEIRETAASEQAHDVRLVPDTRPVTAPLGNPDNGSISAPTCHSCRCEGCSAELLPLAPVWHRRVTTAPGRYRWLTLCAACETAPPFAERAGYEYPLLARTCSTCLRPLAIFRGTPEVFCSRACSRRFSRAQALARATTARRRACVVCGRAFDPSRADAVTCSHACRQKRYRREVAGRKTGNTPRPSPPRPLGPRSVRRSVEGRAGPALGEFRPTVGRNSADRCALRVSEQPLIRNPGRSRLGNFSVRVRGRSAGRSGARRGEPHRAQVGGKPARHQAPVVCGALGGDTCGDVCSS